MLLRLPGLRAARALRDGRSGARARGAHGPRATAAREPQEAAAHPRAGQRRRRRQCQSGLEVLWGEPGFHGYQSGQLTVFRGTCHNRVVLCIYVARIAVLRAVWTGWYPRKRRYHRKASSPDVGAEGAVGPPNTVVDFYDSTASVCTLAYLAAAEARRGRDVMAEDFNEADVMARLRADARPARGSGLDVLW